MPEVRIAVIGAGSIAWSATLIRDLCLAQNLWNCTVSLMDTNKERLDLIYNFAKRYASEVKANLKFEKTMDRGEAIKDSDFVINAAMSMGHQYYERMRAVSEKYGYYRGINSVEWNMVSDYHTIWGHYQFRLMMDVARDIENLSPDAWLLMLANPVFDGTTLVSRESKVKVIGLCHGHLGYQEMVSVLGLKLKDVEFISAGFNHVIWAIKFHYKGENAFPLLDRWIEERARKYWRTWYQKQKSLFDLQMSPAAIDMYRNYGSFPVGDSVRGGTWKYHWNLEVKKKWFGPMGGPDSEIGWKIYLGDHNKRLNRFIRAVRNQKTPLVELVPPKISQESVVPIINAMVNDEKGVYQVNIPNQEAINGIPDNVVVEVPVEIDGKGIHRIHVGSLPRRVMKYVMQPRMMRMEWALEAFIEGGKDSIFEWLIVDPRTKSTKQVEQTIDRILSIPGNEEMAKHYSL